MCLPTKHFLHALALRLGRTVAELRDSLSEEEFRWWQAYHHISPISDDRGDYHAAITSSTMANAMRGPKTTAYKITDFLPKWGGACSKKQQTPEAMRALFLAAGMKPT